MFFKKEKYDLIFSLGFNCACTAFLRNNGLQQKSLPFDWLTHASFEERVDLICNDFKDFFNYSDFVLLRPSDDKNLEANVDCDYYHNKRTDFYFLHDFPYGMPFSDSYVKIKEKYDRRIKRLYEQIEQSDKVLVVFFSPSEKLSDERLKRALLRLNKKFPDKKIDILVLENDSDSLLNVVEKEKIDTCIIKYKYNMFKADIKKSINKVMGNKKIGNKIFGYYHLNVPFSVRMKNSIILFFIAIIPIKKIRRRIRSEYYHKKDLSF